LDLFTLSFGVDPALIIGFNVAPTRLDLSPESPNELGVHGGFEDSKGAVSKDLHFSIIEVVGVVGAHTVSGGIGRADTKWSNGFEGSIEVDSVRLRHVGLGALNP
jgi:hypothetical protein